MLMTERQTVRNFYGKILGYIDVDKNTGNKVAYNFYNKILGKYFAKENITKDVYNKILASGDITSALVYNSENKQ